MCNRRLRRDRQVRADPQGRRLPLERPLAGAGALESPARRRPFLPQSNDRLSR